MQKLSKDLYAAKGDLIAYSQILMQYYKNSFYKTKKRLPLPTIDELANLDMEINAEQVIRDALEDE